MPIKVEPFINPLRRVTKHNGVTVDIVMHNGKKYEKLVRKK
jgi:hypothetical protein